MGTFVGKLGVGQRWGLWKSLLASPTVSQYGSTTPNYGVQSVRLELQLLTAAAPWGRPVTPEGSSTFLFLYDALGFGGVNEDDFSSYHTGS